VAVEGKSGKGPEGEKKKQADGRQGSNSLGQRIASSTPGQEKRGRLFIAGPA
jgi:hypothetical protein